MSEKRRAILRLNNQVLELILRGKARISNFPEDVVFHGIAYDFESETMLVKMSSETFDKIQEGQAIPLFCEETQDSEMARLTFALHANRCHPDYTYIVVPISGSGFYEPSLDGWERNPEYKAAPGDECWRRKNS